mgnify:CR=1 FL=1
MENPVEELAKIAEIQPVEFAKQMFMAGSNLKNKSPEEIFYQDFKKFSAGDISFGVGGKKQDLVFQYFQFYDDQ